MLAQPRRKRQNGAHRFVSATIFRMIAHPTNLRVSLLAIPDTFMSCLAGLFDTLSVSRDVASGHIPFDLAIVVESRQ